MVSRNDRIWVIYPEYFDAGRSRLKGRRVNRQNAFAKISRKDILDAALALEMGPVIEERDHPSDWYRRRGRVLVRKDFSKGETIRRIAMEIRSMREAAKKEESGTSPGGRNRS